MLISINWLKQFTEINNTDELLGKIASQIAEIESTTSLKDKYEGLVVAEIRQAEDHPDADKLRVYQVNTGAETVQVVAGDKTLKEGDKVAYIAPGQTVPASFDDEEPFVIEKRPLRGKDSNGMMASAAELDWGDDHTKVLKLDINDAPGTSLIDAYELDDIIIEVENKALTHRPDCFGFIGFAREVAGVSDDQFKTPDWFREAVDEAEKSSQSLPLSITIETEGEDCPRYVGIVLDSVKVKASPTRMQSYLSRVGIRPINNIVDITNYLMVESGQPLHAFDYDKVSERSKNDAAIVVRYPNKDEKIKLLDGREIEPREKAVLISTDQEAVAVGGAMGGSDTEVDENTKTVLLESANFNLYNIRRTSMQHGIFSEAVTRFIRGQDPEQCLNVALRAVKLMSDYAGAKQASEPVDEYIEKSSSKKIEADSSFINKRLGADFSDDEMVQTLTNVELKVDNVSGKLIVSPPSWRKDLNIKEDIVEEVGRLTGYDNLEVTLPARDLNAASLDDKQKLIQKIRRVLVEAGSNEILSYNFRHMNDLEKASLDTNLAYKLRNSISPDLQVLRTALLPSLLEKIHPNIKAGYSEFALFEINKSHRNNNVEDDLPVEELSVAYVFAADSKMRNEDVFGAAYYPARQVSSYLLDELNIAWTDVVELNEVSDDWAETRKGMFNTKRAAAIVSDKGVIGVLGEFSSTTRRNHKLPVYSSGFELRLDMLLDLQMTSSNYVPQLKYPSTQKDITFQVSSDTKNRDVLNVMAEGIVDIKDMQNSVITLDIFQKDEKTKNLTYRIELRHKERTLKTEEANDLVTQMAEVVESKLGAKVS